MTTDRQEIRTGLDETGAGALEITAATREIVANPPATPTWDGEITTDRRETSTWGKEMTARAMEMAVAKLEIDAGLPARTAWPQEIDPIPAFSESGFGVGDGY